MVTICFEKLWIPWGTRASYFIQEMYSRPPFKDLSFGAQVVHLHWQARCVEANIYNEIPLLWVSLYSCFKLIVLPGKHWPCMSWDLGLGWPGFGSSPPAPRCNRPGVCVCLYLCVCCLCQPGGKLQWGFAHSRSLGTQCHLSRVTGFTFPLAHWYNPCCAYSYTLY